MSLLSAASIATTLLSCSKNGSSITPVNPASSSRALNATELSLLGAWQLNAQIDTFWEYSKGSLYAPTQTEKASFTAYYRMRLDSIIAADYFLQITPQALSMMDSRSGSEITGYWYFNGTTRFLYLASSPFTIVSQDGHNLSVMQEVDARYSGTGTLHRIYWNFSRWILYAC